LSSKAAAAHNVRENPKWSTPLCLIIGLLAVGLGGCEKKGTAGPTEGEARGQNIAVFVPGMIAGSPVYEMLVQGVRGAVSDWNTQGGKADMTLIEGGFNQAEWESQVTTLAASGNYDLIVSSNPSLPVIVQEVSARFPTQQFLLLDAELSGNPQVYTLGFNNREEAFMAGYFAALTAGELARQGLSSQWKPRVGLVAAQEYPVMNEVILPAYWEGAQAVDPAFTVDFRVVGNWFDAARAAELAGGMIRDGVGVILCIAGSANEGVVQAAAEGGAKVVWFDTSGYRIRPGVILGSAILREDKAAYEKTWAFLAGNLPFGRAETAGIAEGFVDFDDQDPLYLSWVSEEIRKKQGELLERLRSGKLKI